MSQGLSTPVVPLPYGTLERSSDASLVQKAFLFGQYICTYLLVLRLLYATSNPTNNNNAESEIAHLIVMHDLVQKLVSNLCVSVIPILDRGRFLLRPSDNDPGRAINIETRPELSNGLNDDGLASACHSHLVCITTWSLGILKDGDSTAAEFGVDSNLIHYLQEVNSSVVAN